MRLLDIMIVMSVGVLFLIPMNATFENSKLLASDQMWPSDDWIISTPEEQNMSSSHLNEMLQFFDENLISINSVVIIRHGYMVMEEYFDFFNENTSVGIFSCTKTITSTLVGIAIDMGYIDNVSIPMLEFFQDRTIENMNEMKESITIQDLLTMRAGFEWNDNSDAGMSEYNQMLRSDDWVQYVLDRPMAVQPGTVFNYNSGASLLLSAIIQNVTGMTSEEFGEEYLFGPIGIPNVNWRENSQGITIGGNTLSLTAKQMARIGYLYLRNGIWNGEQVVSSDWISEASSTKTIVGGNTGYGYQIWTRDDIGSFSARGYAGQYIFVLPEHDLVVVFQATSGWPNTSLEDWIIPSIEEFGQDPQLLLQGIQIVAIASLIIAVPVVSIFAIRHRRLAASE